MCLIGNTLWDWGQCSYMYTLLLQNARKYFLDDVNAYPRSPAILLWYGMSYGIHNLDNLRS